MRPLSRLLSVFLALVLLATSFLVASAHSGDSTAKITIARVDTESDVHVGTKLKFLVIIERGGHNIIHTATVGSVYSQDVDGTDTLSAPNVQLGTASGVAAGTGTDDAFTGSDPALTSASPVGTIAEFVYTVQDGELGSAQQRTIPIQFQLIVAAGVDDDPTAGDGHPHLNTDTDDSGTNDQLVIKSNVVNVVVTKDPGTGDGASQVTVNVAMTRPDDIAASEKVKFTVSSETGKYGFGPKPLIVSKQLYDEDGDKDGGLVAVAVFTLADLQSNSVSAEQSKEYTLVQDDIDASKVEFSYAVEITAADLDGEPANYATDKTQKGTFNLAPPAPEPEATPEPAVGMTTSATVTKGEGNLIDIERHDGGADFSLGVGILDANGMLHPHNNGYIRDSDLGQTYAVVNRESDGMIVRVWISSSSPHVGDIDWASVLDFYNVPADVVNAIPLDHTVPSANQLVDAGGTWYVYTGGAWRHIPDIPTFQSRGYYYCDLTTATADWADSIMTGQALPSSGGAEDPDYPVCHS